jgi:hypothetical protein
MNTETIRKETLEDIDIERRTVLKWIARKYVANMWIGLNWLKIGPKGAFGLYKGRGIY